MSLASILSGREPQGSHACEHQDLPEPTTCAEDAQICADVRGYAAFRRLDGGNTVDEHATVVQGFLPITCSRRLNLIR